MTRGGGLNLGDRTHLTLKIHHADIHDYENVLWYSCGTSVVHVDTTEITTGKANFIRVPHTIYVVMALLGIPVLWYSCVTKMSCGIPVVLLWYM